MDHPRQMGWARRKGVEIEGFSWCVNLLLQVVETRERFELGNGIIQVAFGSSPGSITTHGWERERPSWGLQGCQVGQQGASEGVSRGETTEQRERWREGSTSA